MKWNKKVKEYLVEWHGFGPEENSWLDEAELVETDAYADYIEDVNKGTTMKRKRPSESPHEAESQNARFSKRLELKKRRKSMGSKRIENELD